MKMTLAQSKFLEAAARRRKRALAMREKGLTFVEIGAKLGISPQRAQVIVARESRQP
jgi:orotate phosphoribosyltransferase-like protein